MDIIKAYSTRLPWIFQKHLDFKPIYIHRAFFRKCDQRSFNLESSPRYVIPGEETAVFVSRNLDTNCRRCSNPKLEVQLSITFVKPKASPVALYNKRWTVDTTDLVEDSSRYQPSFGKLQEKKENAKTSKLCWYIGITTLQYVMNAKLSKHRFWHCHENGLI